MTSSTETNKKPTMNINNRPYQFTDGETVLQVARRAGYDIPTLCYLEGFRPSGACRICVVENADNGRLLASCAHPAAEGLSILTDSARVRQSRRTTVKLLLANHPQDCLACVRSGECLLQDLSRQFAIDQVPFQGERRKNLIDRASPAVERDMDKCILCGRCVTVCEERQKVSALDFAGRGFTTRISPGASPSLHNSPCISCGQCIMACPVGALLELPTRHRVIDALTAPDKVVAFQIAPACQMTMPEFFSDEISVAEATGRIVTALKRIGANLVIDTCTGADLTIMEEAAEFAGRLKLAAEKGQQAAQLPMFTSCCPAWINYAETFLPDLLAHLSSCKSPQAMEGAMLKVISQEKLGIDPQNLFVVSVMPCVAKKSEVNRPELSNDGMHNVDAVLTTREFFALLNEFGIQYGQLSPQPFDTPFSQASGAGKIFGATGGVMEAALRTAHYLLTGSEAENIDFTDVRGNEDIKYTSLTVAGTTVNIAVVNGLGNVLPIVEEIRAGKSNLHFVEVMSCAGGCIGGAGQPFGLDAKILTERARKTYLTDSVCQVRHSHRNPEIQGLYQTWLDQQRAHEYLHTHYRKDDKK